MSGPSRAHCGTTHDIWLIRWGAGSRTELHDHGGSTGALYVADGRLVEYRPGPAPTTRPRRRDIRRFDHRAMPATHIHAVANESTTIAASIHVYSPPLSTMQHYELQDGGSSRGSGLRPRLREVLAPDTLAADDAAPQR